ncbi:MAG: hypothetical protein KGJ90_06850 [Patescibacteria group bacterium]|nr:hypothetical protein [Patescibacteria group bacterium]
MKNELDEGMDRMWSAEQEHRRKKEFEETGIGKITYKNGEVIFTPINREDFYK